MTRSSVKSNPPGRRPAFRWRFSPCPPSDLQNRNYFSFAGSFVKSLFAARKIFRNRRPDAVLAMGGFTSAPPVLAARRISAQKLFCTNPTPFPAAPTAALAFGERGVRRISRSRRAVEGAPKSRRPARRCVRNFGGARFLTSRLARTFAPPELQVAGQRSASIRTSRQSWSSAAARARAG